MDVFPMHNVTLQIYSFCFDCGLSFLAKYRTPGEQTYAIRALVAGS